MRQEGGLPVGAHGDGRHRRRRPSPRPSRRTAPSTVTLLDRGAGALRRRHALVRRRPPRSRLLSVRSPKSLASLGGILTNLLTSRLGLRRSPELTAPELLVPSQVSTSPSTVRIVILASSLTELEGLVRAVQWCPRGRPCGRLRRRSRALDVAALGGERGLARPAVELGRRVGAWRLASWTTTRSSSRSCGGARRRRPQPVRAAPRATPRVRRAPEAPDAVVVRHGVRPFAHVRGRACPARWSPPAAHPRPQSTP